MCFKHYWQYCCVQLMLYISIHIILFHFYLDGKKEPRSPFESDDYFVFPKHLEMLGDKAKDCGVSLTLEWTGMDTEANNNTGVTYILYRCKKNINEQRLLDHFVNFMYVITTLKPCPSLVLFSGGLPQISSRAALWRRHAYTPSSSTPCTLVIIFHAMFSRHHAHFRLH